MHWLYNLRIHFTWWNRCRSCRNRRYRVGQVVSYCLYRLRYIYLILLLLSYVSFKFMYDNSWSKNVIVCYFLNCLRTLPIILHRLFFVSSFNLRIYLLNCLPKGTNTPSQKTHASKKIGNRNTVNFAPSRRVLLNRLRIIIIVAESLRLIYYYRSRGIWFYAWCSLLRNAILGSV